MVELKEIIQERISRRSFLKESLSSEEIIIVNNYLHKLNQESNLSMEFLEDGSKAFANLLKSYGLFSNVRSMILMEVRRVI